MCSHEGFKENEWDNQHLLPSVYQLTLSGYKGIAWYTVVKFCVWNALLINACNTYYYIFQTFLTFANYCYMNNNETLER